MSSTTGRSATTQQATETPKAGLGIFAGSGEACELARSVDWSATPIGPVAGWSQALRSTASLVLHNHSAMLLWWGPEFVQIYNDAYRPVLGDKHPRAMGQLFRDCWSEVFHILGPMAERPFRGGPASSSDDIAVPINRKIQREEAHFRLAYSPVPDESVETTGIGGVLATVTEITDEVYASRQIRTLRELGVRSAADTQSAEQACAIAATALKENAWDVPFALFYLLDRDGEEAHLVAKVGFDESSIPQVAPPQVGLAAADDPGPWPLRRVIEQREAEIVAAPARYRDALPASPWSEPSNYAIALPLAAPGQARPYGVLVCGVSPHRVLDAGYRTFFELVAAQVATAIRNARALEEERRRAAALAEIDRAKTAFFSNVSHEFRTPLTLMLGPVEEAIADRTTPAPVRAHLEIALRNSLRLQKLVNSLLDFSRIEAGRVQASYDPTDLANLTRDLASTFRSAVERAGLTYTVDCQALGEPVHVDREMWEKIVLNLLSNAFKYTLQGRIAVRLSRQDSHAIFEVSDTGLGIPAHELPRIFERFHRVEGTAGRTQEGTGIGLALVQELVKLHGGLISVKSELGCGTTFSVILPIGTAHLPAGRIRAPRTLVSTAMGPNVFVQEALRWVPEVAGETWPRLPALAEPLESSRFAKAAGARVLVVDDNSDMRAYVRQLLSPHYLVAVAGDGEQALEAVRIARPDLILSDIMMPKVDGLALLKALRADDRLREIPVIILSARTGEGDRVEGLRAGADDYLAKPFSAQELLARVGALIELTRMRRENEERFHAFMSATSDVIYRMSPDWKEMRQLEGRSFVADTSDPSRTWLDSYIPRDEQPRVMAAIEEAIRTQRVFQLEHRVLQVDGGFGWVISRAVPLRDQDGNIMEWFGAASDVTERKRAEERLREADRQKDEFLAMLAHELRNPLAPIGIASEILSRMLDGDERARDVVGMIKRQATHLTRLVDDLLDISRITQGRIQLRRRPADLTSIITQAVETVEPRLREKQHKLSIIAATGYEPLYVDVDFARLVQCVVNILSNAAKYTDPRGEIRIQSRAEGATAVIQIADNGAGIPPELLPNVFGIFVQSERTLDRAQGGLGIGLAIVKRLIEMHGGSVTAHSPGLGQGSTFEIRLPRIPRPQASSMEETPVKARPRRIFIVDDNVDAAMSLAMLLKFQGHETETAYGGRDALERVEAFRPDVALLDIGLPEMNGYVLAKRLRALPTLKGLRLVALTGYGQAEDRLQARAAGFDDHLVKPVDVAALERSLARVSARAAEDD